MAAVLDADADFRAKVAEVVTEATPELVQAVRDGTSTAASDPVDTAIVAYLTRPDGWTDTVAQANARWADGRDHSDASTEQIGKLREELAELRAVVKTEPARARKAAQEAQAQSAVELSDLRRQLRTQAAQQRALATAAEEAQAALAEANRRLETAASGYEAELRRVRARITELERTAETTRRGARVERDVDAARLWLLVGTLTEAAAGIRRELNLPEPAVRPGDTVASVRPEQNGGAPMTRRRSTRCWRCPTCT